MKKFEIMEKFYSSKTLLKMAGGGDAYAAQPTSPLNPPLVVKKQKMALNFKRDVSNQNCRR